ncbi:hypothetical protein SPRG_07233 [Saprolegnia parasitica CBS 223.65]|uniref:FYVE-type domain-containing protein n=1 Tax=Saprolegnia parasitica (strain CBS 223.65) TaxID=695850 RepID=A0A067CMA4_SAPPC|nr:hypothetical protein SPRG_07233 [Saprolegnia parasitica CBS 223.65]KDO27957.1 hypothetical protein SPRG_07233 [Saprolegnia parasitica CBS 223.65]|eukprot:XP_012201407.1 hypothetical protein SPRG_07233 [Saprolegnia parasitica CBS 223.65]
MPPGRFAEVLNEYVPVVTPYIATELLKLGHARVYDALFDQREMRSIGTSKKVALFEARDEADGSAAMMGCVEVSGHVLDAHRFLGNQLQNAGSIANELQAMSSLFGSLFLDGYVLHTVHHPGEKGPYEQMSINWSALQPPHSSHVDRDYVFLQYADVYARNGPELHRVSTDELSLRQVHDSRLVACHIWESVELDGTDPLPHLALSRDRLRRWYFLAEAVSQGRVRISFVMTYPCAQYHRNYTEKFMQRLSRLESLLSKECDISPICNLCLKTFSLFRRKIQCKTCKLNFCAKCILVSKESTSTICNACNEGNPMGLLRRIAATNSSDSDSVHSTNTSLALPTTPPPLCSLSRSHSTPNVKRRSSADRTTSSTLSSSQDDSLLLDEHELSSHMIRVDFSKW